MFGYPEAWYSDFYGAAAICTTHDGRPFERVVMTHSEWLDLVAVPPDHDEGDELQ